MAIAVNFGGKLIKQLGTYVKTDLSAVRSINGVPVGIPAVLGLAEGGEVNRPYRFLSYSEALQILKGGPLLDHIKALFLGGAGEVVAVRIANPTASTLTIPVSDGTQSYDWVFESLEKSTLSNQIYLEFVVNNNGTSSDPSDDLLILTITQRMPDCSEYKERYIFPRFFNDYVVLVKRGDNMFFLDSSYINAVKANYTPGSQQFKDALVALLRSVLNADDEVQIFEPGDPVPLGLVLYEINVGGLFGFAKSRILKTYFTNDTILYDTNFDPFFDGVQYRTYNDLATNNYIVKSIVTVDKLLDSSINGVILSTGVYVLSGGSNGDDGTGYYQSVASNYLTYWANGLASLEDEEVNYVVPAYRFKPTVFYAQRKTFFKTVSGVTLAHVTLMSSVHIRRRRTAVFGFPAPSQLETVNQNTYVDEAAQIGTSMFGGSDRVQFVVFPFKSPVFSPRGEEELLGGEFAASYITGMHANREVQDSITFLPVGGLGAIPLYNWTYTQKDTFISNRILFIEKVKNSVGAYMLRVHHNPTTWLGSSNTGYQEFILRRIDDFVTVYLYKNLEDTFIGRRSYGRRTAQEIKAYVELLLSRLVGQQIVAFKDVTVTPNEDRTVYYVEFFFQPVTEIKFILVTMKVTFNLE